MSRSSGLSQVQAGRLRLLARSLEAAGVADFLATLTAPVSGPRSWSVQVDRAAGMLRALLDLFTMGRPCCDRDLPADVLGGLEVLDTLGLVSRTSGTSQMREIVLVRPWSTWLFVEPAAPWPTTHYFGNDSVSLAATLTISRGARVLDLCAGTGLQGLVSAARARSVDMVELAARPAQVAQVNAAMNDYADKVAVHVGDLYNALPITATFDHVIANVPFLPRARVGRDGQVDLDLGSSLTEKVLRGAPVHLNSGGSVHVTTMVWCRADGRVDKDWLLRWAQAHGHHVVVTLAEEFAVDEESGLADAIADQDPAGQVTPTQVAAAFARRGITTAHQGIVRVHEGLAGVTVV